MARGKLLKTKVREEKKLVKARLQAQKEWEERSSNLLHQSKKALLEWAKGLKVDPLDLAGVGAATVMIHGVISTAPLILNRLKDIGEEIGKIGWLLGPGSIVFYGFWRLLQPPTPEESGPPTFELGPPHTIWILSFVLAIILVKHPEVFTTMFSEAGKLTTFALGLLA